MNKKTSNLKIVVIGGGTGSFTILSGLKKFTSNLSAIVNMTDDGGSTGILRDELGALPPGDIRQCLVALSDSENLRELFNYRFRQGGLRGHAFGNLFIAALEKMTGNFADAVKVAGEVLNINGRVIPVTLNDTRLIMKKRRGGKVIRQFLIGNMKFDYLDKRPFLQLSPNTINPAAKAAIDEADLVVIAPGNLYGSLAPVLLVSGMAEALTESSAKKIYVCNLVTKPGQTDDFCVHDFCDEVERFIGKNFLDGVLFNTRFPQKDLLKKYQKSKEYGVKIDRKAFKDKSYKVRGRALISAAKHKPALGDAIAGSRAFIRHEPVLTARQILRFFEEI